MNAHKNAVVFAIRQRRSTGQRNVVVGIASQEHWHTFQVQEPLHAFRHVERQVFLEYSCGHASRIIPPWPGSRITREIASGGGAVVLGVLGIHVSG